MSTTAPSADFINQVFVALKVIPIYHIPGYSYFLKREFTQKHTLPQPSPHRMILVSFCLPNFYFNMYPSALTLELPVPLMNWDWQFCGTGVTDEFLTCLCVCCLKAYWWCLSMYLCIYMNSIYISKISQCVTIKYRMVAALCILSSRLVASCFSKDKACVAM